MKNITLTIITLTFAFVAQAQSIERKVINTVGTSYHTPGLTVKASVGEPIVGRRGNGVSLSQGFFTSRSASATTTSISDPKDEVKVVISPNPATDLIYILGPANENLSVQILNMLGQTVVERSSITGTHSVAQLAPGMYIVQIYDKANQLIQSSRIIKQ